MDRAARSVDNVGDQARQSSIAMRSMGTVGRSAGRMLGTTLKYGALGAGAGIAALGAFSVKAALEAQKVTAQTDAFIKSTGGAANVTTKHVQNLSTNLMNLSGIDDELVQGGANLLGTFTKIQNKMGAGNDIFDQATKSATDMSIALDQDVTSSAMQLGKALQDPITGMTALRRVGVAFTEDQQEMVGKWVESNQLLKAQKFILAELNKEFGKSSKLRGQTDLGKMQIAFGQISNAMEKIGNTIIPILGKIAGPLANSIVVLFEELGPSIARTVRTLARLFVPLIRQLAPLFNTVARALLPIVNILGKMFIQVLKELMPVLKPLIKELGGAMLEALKAIAPYIPEIARSMTTFMLALVPLIPPLSKIIALLLRLTAMSLAGFAQAVSGPMATFVGWISKAVGWVDRLLGGLGQIPGVATTASTAVGTVRSPTATGFSPATATPPNQLNYANQGPAGRAAGGPVSAYRPYIVGEQRPEIFVPKVSGTILPSTQGLGTVNNYITVNESSNPEHTARLVAKHVSDKMARR